MMENLKLSVPDKHLRVAWKGINEVVVYNDSNTSDTSSASNLLTIVKLRSSMHEPILRYLAIQSYHIFESTQQLVEIDLESILMKSKEYRAILVECEEQILLEIQNLESLITLDEEKYYFMTLQCNIIRDYQMLWHLAEIFFIKLSSPGYFIHDLQNWLNLQQPHVSLNYNFLMDEYNQSNGDIDLEINGNFWPTVFCLAIQGRNAELSNLLACHTHANGQAFRIIRELINMMPVFNENFAKSAIEFEFAWTQWHKMAKTGLADSYLLNPYPELGVLAKIILGQTDVFLTSEIMEISEGCWFYAIIGYFFFSNPLIDAKTVSGSYKQFKKSFRTAGHQCNDTTADLCSEEILQAIDATFNMDLTEFVCNITRNSNNWWLPAHLVDLIEKINPLLFPDPLGDSRSTIFDADYIQGSHATMREHFILQYAAGFTSPVSLVPIGLNYMNFCRQAGRAQASHVIDHLYMPTDTFATQIHNWCVRNKYDDMAASICKRRCVSFFKEAQYGNSLIWAVKANNTNFISRIGDKLLRDLFTDTNESNVDLMECLRQMNLGLIGKKMTFVIQFSQVQMLMKNKQFEEAARLLIDVVDCQLVSRHYNVDILVAIKPLLAQPDLFKTDDIYKLMEILQEAEDDSRQPQVKELRLLLSSELSRACLKS